MFEPKPMICIDPGHGGSNFGASGGGTHEKHLTLPIAVQLEQILEDTGQLNVVKTRTEDRDVGLTSRAKVAETWGAQLAISIHLNRSEQKNKRGGYVLWERSEESARAAKTMAEAWNKTEIKYPGHKNLRLFHGIAKKGWSRVQNVLRPYGVRGIPAILLEVGFMTNNADFAIWSNPARREYPLCLVADGILDYFDKPRMCV